MTVCQGPKLCSTTLQWNEMIHVFYSWFLCCGWLFYALRRFSLRVKLVTVMLINAWQWRGCFVFMEPLYSHCRQWPKEVEEATEQCAWMILFTGEHEVDSSPTVSLPSLLLTLARGNGWSPLSCYTDWASPLMFMHRMAAPHSLARSCLCFVCLRCRVPLDGDSHMALKWCVVRKAEGGVSVQKLHLTTMDVTFLKLTTINCFFLFDWCFFFQFTVFSAEVVPTVLLCRCNVCSLQTCPH